MKLALVAAAITSGLLTMSVIAAEYGAEQNMSISASGTKASGNNGFFAFPDNDLKFTYDPTIKEFVPQDSYGVGFHATVINETSGASSFKLEAKADPDNKVLHSQQTTKGFKPQITIGSVALSNVYQEINPQLDLNITDDLTQVTGPQGVRYDQLTMGVQQGQLTGGVSSAEDLPPGTYGGNVSLTFKATWNQ